MRAKAGTPARLPFDVLVHLVAARYGQSPAQVRRWPAADFAMALSLVDLTNG